MKKCSSCQKLKEPIEFYKNVSKEDGLSSYCKPCCKKADSIYYQKNKEKVWIAREKYRKSENGRKATIKKSRTQYRKNLEKWKARAKLRNAVYAGQIIKPDQCTSVKSNPCSGRIEAHHYLGYEGEHWKDVEWLCRNHHFEIHGKKYHVAEEKEG